MQAFSASNSSIRANPTSIITGETSQVTVTVRDVYNELIRDKNVRINTINTDPTVTISPLSGRTDENGEIVFQVSKSSEGSIGTKVNVDHLEILSENLIQVIPLININVENSSIVASPTNITVLSQEGAPLIEGYYSTVTVTLRDDKNEVIPGIEVGLETSLRGGVVSPISRITDMNGRANFTVSSYSLGIMNIIAGAEDVEIIAKSLITVVEDSSGGGSTTPEECEKGGGIWDKIKETCVCPEGFVWNETTKICEKGSSGPSQEECEKGGGEWDEKTLTCICREGEEWNPDTKTCELIVSPEQAGCESTGGTWEDGKCTCREGFIWNSDKNICEEK
jgi:hypothetical protein